MYMKKTSLSIFITSICIALLIPQTFKKNYYLDSKDGCETSPILGIIKKVSVLILFFKVLYRIYFCSGWIYLNNFGPKDPSYKTKLQEIMTFQRGYRTIFYGIITFISCLSYFISAYFEYKILKTCLIQKNNYFNDLYKKERFSFICMAIIAINYIIELLFLRYLVLRILKNWNKIDYGIGKNSIFKQIFFFNKINFIQIISFIIYFIILFFSYKFI